MSVAVDTDPAVIAARAVAAIGTTEAQLAYVLTTKALAKNTAPMVFPLLALSLTSIVEGLAAYTAEVALARVEGLPRG